jgi:hypothetical protein
MSGAVPVRSIPVERQHERGGTSTLVRGPLAAKVDALPGGVEDKLRRLCLVDQSRVAAVVAAQEKLVHTGKAICRIYVLSRVFTHD